MNTNIVIFTGNLTRDAELKNTASGTSILSFSVAVNDRVKSNGEWTDRANYIDCVMFGTRAESLSKFLHKGIKVAVIGKLHWSSYEKEGKKRSKIDIYVETVELLTPKQNGSQNEPQSQEDVSYDITELDYIPCPF